MKRIDVGTAGTPARENVERRALRLNSRSVVVLRNEKSVGYEPPIRFRSRALFLPRRLLAVLILATAFYGGASAGAQEPADLIVRNGRIYRMDAARSWADALAVKGGRIVFVGAEDTIDDWIGHDTTVVDAEGRMILPGFHDAHAHIVMTALRQRWCDLGYPPTLEATRSALAACAEQSGDRNWVLAANPNTAVFPKGGPERGFLDLFVSDRPLVVNAYHSTFVNEAALAIAGVTTETRDPEDGQIIRDETGRPTGTLLESAQSLVLDLIPQPSPDELASDLRAVLGNLSRYGIVSVQDPAGSYRVALYARAHARGELKTRIRLAQVLEGGEDAPSLEEGLEQFVDTVRKYRGHWIHAGTVKIFVDGDLGDRTAALSGPYQDEETDWRGEPIWSQPELNEWAARLDAAKMQLHFHAVGDRATHMAFDAIEHAQEVNGRRDARHQITHLHLISPSDLPRFRELGVIANVQPYFAENVEYNTQLALDLLGSERHQWMFRFRDLVDRGAVLAASSDAPVSPLNPFVSIQAALTRRVPGSDAPAFAPEQRLTLPEALAAYTIGAAHANFQDDLSGSLEVGKSADFVMLDRNVFDSDPETVHATQVLWTVIEGREVFRSPDLNDALHHDPIGDGDVAAKDAPHIRRILSSEQSPPLPRNSSFPGLAGKSLVLVASSPFDVFAAWSFAWSRDRLPLASRRRPRKP